MIITIPIVGYISDFIGRRTIYIAGLIAMIALAIPYFLAVPAGTGWFFTMQILLLGGVWASTFATQGTFFSELFPANVRYTGLSLGYQVAAAIVGFGPMLWATMGDRFGAAPYLFGGFMIGGLLISLILSIFSPDTRTVTQYEEHAELGDLEEPELKVTPSGKQLNY